MVVLLAGLPAFAADPVRRRVDAGNRLFADGEYAEAINAYNEALVDRPEALRPKFNKAASYYRLDDLGEAIDLFQEVAAKTKDMSLVAKAKYNLGNCFFQRGTKQRDSDLQKAIDEMKASIAFWRQVLEIEPENAKAARNIEVARLTIKDLLDQLKKQQDQQQEQQQDQEKQEGQRDQQPDQAQSQQDPNQPQDPNQTGSQQPEEPNQPPQQEAQPQEGQSQETPEEQSVMQDMTAQEIIDREQRQKQQRQVLQRGRIRPVEKDW
jgi:Ca-activated chloride channel family protein